MCWNASIVSWFSEDPAQVCAEPVTMLGSNTLGALRLLSWQPRRSTIASAWRCLISTRIELAP